MHDPMYMLVNLAVGGPAGTPTDGLPHGADMKIDYIKAYSLAEHAATATTASHLTTDDHWQT
jgi:beta-glucanase (GH16 family)